MREIKFRTWDNCCNAPEYREDGMSDLLETNTFGNLLRFSDAIKELWPDDVLMQYTGLKDKNGKEIYEGDILKDKDGAKGKIYWRIYGWDVSVYSKPNNFDWPAWAVPVRWIELEVIGNIYENPELLEKV